MNKIFCGNCDHEVVPLELFNGKWHCSECKKEIDLTNLVKNKKNNGSNNAFYITEENKDLFELSEICWGKYLVEVTSGNKEEDHKKRTERLNDLKEKAVGYCYSAMQKGNPYALLKMGYYLEKGYYKKEIIGKERSRLATQYYLSLAKTDKEFIVSEKGEYESIEELKNDALRHLKIIATFNYGDLSNAQQNEVNDIIPDVDFNEGREAEKETVIDGFEKVLKSCKEGTGPVYAVFIMTEGHFKEATEKKAEGENKSWANKFVDGKDVEIEIWCDIDPEELGIDTISYQQLITVQKKAFADFSNEDEKDKICYVIVKNKKKEKAFHRKQYWKDFNCICDKNIIGETENVEEKWLCFFEDDVKFGIKDISEMIEK